ncbi:MAG: ATP-binding cassette domain-containing protein [Pseudomonadota bacterium]|nr:ATP-binding cassette domain-containing protein [Pseudomonadota bacterium]
MLTFNQISVLRDNLNVIENLSLSCPSPGILWLMGTGGAGKSSTLAALAGADSEELRLQGKVELNGENIHSGNLNVLYVPQHAQVEPSTAPLMTQLRVLAPSLMPKTVLDWLTAMELENPRAAANGPTKALCPKVRKTLRVLVALQMPGNLWLLDEPTADLDEPQIKLVRQAIAEAASTKGSVIVATHNRQDCLILGGHVALIAGGVLQEFAPSAQFFSAPSTAAGRTYVETGNCNLPRKPQADDKEIPRGIWWVVRGLMCGMSRPGMVTDATEQYRYLANSNIKVLINLEEAVHYPSQELRDAGIEFRHFPMPDMSAPSFDQALDICRLAESLIRNNQGIVLHCRGGLGRTGTGLASILIWHGETAENAISIIRTHEPKAIQSRSQVAFLHDFAERIHGWRSTPAPPQLQQPGDITNVP